MTPGTAMTQLDMEARLAQAMVRGLAAECEWRLPSGEDLISFALATGFAAGPLLPGPVEQVAARPAGMARHGRQRRRM